LTKSIIALLLYGTIGTNVYSILIAILALIYCGS